MNTITKQSVQSLLIEMQFNGKALATGTGFVVESPSNDPYLLTNLHNVTGKNPHTGETLSKTGGVPNEIIIIHNRKGKLGEWVFRKENLYDNLNPLWIEHPTLGAKADFVALKLKDIDDVETYPYAPDNPGPKILVGPADPVSVIGFPFGVTAGGAFGVWATGFLASEPTVDFNDLPIHLIDCRTRQGQSGSPVIAFRSGGAVSLEDGSSAIFNGPVDRFMGIYSGRINAESDLGIVWKASAINELIKTL